MANDIIFPGDGRWVDIPFNAANFTEGGPNGTMTVTVASGDQKIFQYLVQGNMVTVAFDITTITLGGTGNTRIVLALPSQLLPATPVAGAAWIQPYWRISGGTQALSVCSVDAGVAAINCFATETTDSGSDWTLGTDNSRVSGIIHYKKAA